MFGRRENGRKMRERWGCEDLLKKNKSSNGSLFEVFQNREMHVVFKRHEPWTMRNRKEQFMMRSAKRIEVIPGIRKMMVKWVSLLLSHPSSGTPPPPPRKEKPLLTLFFSSFSPGSHSFSLPSAPTSVSLFSPVPPPSIQPILGLTRRWIKNNGKNAKTSHLKGGLQYP